MRRTVSLPMCGLRENGRVQVCLGMEPYVCLDRLCPHNKAPFKDRDTWVSHLAVDHAMEPRWRSIDCPLCKEKIKAGKSVIIQHLQTHLEGLALSALPGDPDSDAEANSETPLSPIPMRNTNQAILFEDARPHQVRIPAEEWEKHKEVILQQYRTSTLQEIKYHMEKEYNFIATVALTIMIANGNTFTKLGIYGVKIKRQANGHPASGG
ncbi:hypothetical protein B0T22DRAFT_523440 [Podospora appendiculata]|uniref:Clr5 domain-containing protein n=1 Tax=Podospora appendiculata TaxID=314037 RepID=A0AAE0WZF3_9PEZI|nr:hypothetical protein B0T22DRAFT_523440 [Podospora appendiculata]